MSNIDHYVNKALVDFINELKSQKPISYSDHQNLFIELGSDIISGDGQIANTVESMLKNYLSGFPRTVRSWLWWQSISGQLEEKYIKKEFECEQLDITTLELDPDEPSELDELKDIFNQRLRILAESAFSELDD